SGASSRAAGTCAAFRCSGACAARLGRGAAEIGGHFGIGHAGLEWLRAEHESDARWRAVMHDAERISRDEHRSIAAVLHGLIFHGRALKENDAPLFGIKPKEESERLFSRIVELTPPPIGLGAPAE